ncbi:hypothetical protein [Paenibacillus sp. N3.4]|uniref:hypothetical protein n=1 Tax=Paenibacillus sp. N3.4 TaxID=2603222 RepID=UPI0021C2EA3A|nr:hypothetical protein [Paenibacillus sp. N3.4]
MSELRLLSEIGMVWMEHMRAPFHASHCTVICITLMAFGTARTSMKALLIHPFLGFDASLSDEIYKMT